MKKLILFAVSFLLCIFQLIAQEEKLEIEGAVQLGNSEDPTPDPGTIRWTGTDFEGWNGAAWISMTAGKKYVKDVDNNNYEIVEIGTQTWMAENLRVTRCNDSTAIPLVTDGAAWPALTTGAYTWYNNGGLDYGALYNWYAVNDCNICPTGWHVPTDVEWTTLIDYLDPDIVDPSANGIQSTIAGGKMKASGLAHWQFPNIGATNESGWSGLPGGYRWLSGSFLDVDVLGFWWSSTQIGSDGLSRDIGKDDSNVSRRFLPQQLGFSIRCLKD